MKAIVLFLALVIVGLSTIDTGIASNTNSTEDVERNKLYFKFIETDAIHAACYYTFCECGQEEYSGYKSPVHEDSCDTHRVFKSDQEVAKCSSDGDCLKKVRGYEDRLFEPLLPKIEQHEIDDDTCTFYLSTCYGMLLKNAVELYNENHPYSYLIRLMQN